VSETEAQAAPASQQGRSNAESRPRSFGRWLRSRTLAQSYCLLVGAFLLLRGASTLAAGASFALPGDGWRATFQLAIAAILLSSSASRTSAYRAVIAVGATYAIITVLGIINGSDVLGIIPVDTRDKIVHPALAVIALAIWVLGRRRSPGPARA